ncbi:DnaB-like helicase C-terminal domain-containing protein [Methylibium sp.]|uniref:DnaB-like helicase C-terminal domain-containing protein n=1 Tax=Methylibium sp. TaxID=2067992 RepID=UPI0017ACC3EF|nr:DnaB-like helicase C-terminal domain-containing protein [Methylibium sp.]MBA3589699.1 AAA family ATPase [Methylibium sp.]
MAEVIYADDIDFGAYLRETETAQKVKPASVYMAELLAGLRNQKTEPRCYLPWEKTHSLVQFRPGEVTLWGGVNGHGKSLMTGMAALSLMSQGERVCIASFEMKPKRTLERMARQWGREDPGAEWLDAEAALRSFEDLYGQFGDWTDGKLWLYDQQGTVNADTMISVARYCAKELGITHLFIDSLMKCVRGEDDFNGQKAFLDELTSLARDCNVHIHLVHHIRKLSSEEDTPDKTDVKGSGSITDQIDNLLLVWRNKKKERERQAGKMVSDSEPDALLICDKQRNGEWEGRIGLWFDKQSQQFVDGAGVSGMPLWNWPHRETT